MRKTGGGEDGDLLATGDRVHGVDGGDTGRDHLFGVHLFVVSRRLLPLGLKPYSRVWVDRAAVDVEVVFRKHLGALVDWLSRTVEDAAQHVFGHTKLQALASELDFCLPLSDMLI